MNMTLPKLLLPLIGALVLLGQDAQGQSCVLSGNGLSAGNGSFGTVVPVSSAPPTSPTPDIFWAKWNDNSGTAFTDSSVEGHNGTINRAGQWEPGKAGSAITNNGTADFGQTTANVVFGTNIITLTFWVYLTGPHNAAQIIIESTGNLNTGDGAFDIIDNGDTANLAIATHFLTAPVYEDVTIPLPSNDTWHNLLIVYDASQSPNVFTIYVDKVLQTPTVVLSGGVAQNFLNAQLFFAARQSSSLFWFGGLDDTRIYSGNQSASVTAIFNDPR